MMAEGLSAERQNKPDGSDRGREVTAVEKLRQLGLTVTTVESCTGGMIAAALTSVPGSSAVLKQAFVTYCDKAKHQMVGVRKKTLKKYTAVSSATAYEMACGGRDTAKADCCISVTGYAGPDTGSGEPVGLVFIGCAVGKKVKVKEFHFTGDREEIRTQAREAALQMLNRRLDKAYLC